MYITFNIFRYHDEIRDEYRENSYKVDLSNLPKPDFMPTKLVRICDMEVVNGSDVNEGYCALSYSWNQSGDIMHDEVTGKYERIDEGKHRIISYSKTRHPATVIPEYKRYGNVRLNKIYKVLGIMCRKYYIDEIKYVKFKGFIQYICQRFSIKYIWCDQLCINQDDKEEKHREIGNMHHIYSNAYCTVALVPDYKRSDTPLGENGEEYFKRLWTLEEAIKSERLLFVGSDFYEWGQNIISFFNSAINILNKPLSNTSVSQILHHAHQRTSTKKHDRVFALIHLFPEFMQHINISYDQPLEDLMIRFYGLLAKKDISILLFERSTVLFPYNSRIQEYKFLPSWTGVNGKHITDDVTTSFQNYDIIGKTMHVTSKFVTNGQSIDNGALTLRKEDLPPFPGDINVGGNKYEYCLCISAQLLGSSETRNVSLFRTLNGIVETEECFDEVAKDLKRLSRFMETKKENLYWCHSKREEYRKVINIYFYNLTEDVDDPLAQYIILSEVSFKREYSGFSYPVIKKTQGEEYYKAIGCCTIECKDIFSDCNLPKQTFSIQ